MAATAYHGLLDEDKVPNEWAKQSNKQVMVWCYVLCALAVGVAEMFRFRAVSFSKARLDAQRKHQGDQVIFADLDESLFPWTFICTEEKFASHLKRPLEELLSKGSGAVVAVDIVGLQENCGIQLMQLGFVDHGVYILDAAKAGKWAFAEGVLRQVLESTAVRKVMHDCRRDSRALWNQFNVTLSNVFDTQIVYGVLEEQGGRQARFDASLSQVFYKYGGQAASRKRDIQTLMKDDALEWICKSRDHDLLDFVAEDVTRLLQAFEHMNAMLGEDSVLVIERKCSKYVHEMRDRAIEALDYTEIIKDLYFDEPREFTFKKHRLTLLPNDTNTTIPLEDHRAPFGNYLPNVAKQNLQEIDLLLSVLPASLRAPLEAHPFRNTLGELVLDIGRSPLVRLQTPGDPFAEEKLSDVPVTANDLEHIRTHDQVSAFASDDRAGISSTLHRLSAIWNRRNELVGLTIRVGRSFVGSVARIEDIVSSGRSVLLLGPPGAGKTSVLREFAKVLAEEFGKRVVVVDTSSEIAGAGNTPHNSIGGARRMIVVGRHEQHQVMVKAVQNHNAQSIVVDEIGDPSEVEAAATIAQRGVQLVGTAHGLHLQTLMKNPELNRLVGGVQAVIVGDAAAKKRGGKKMSSERRESPVFEIVIELLGHNRWVVHQDVAKAVDDILRGVEPFVELREVLNTGKMQISKVRAGQYAGGGCDSCRV